jgi:membrane-associated phospholipid phosphatase
MQMWTYLSLYEMPNDDPAALERRVRVRYPVTIDRAIGLGQLPGVRLQRALARVGGLRKLDAVLVWAHWIWFLVPHTALAYLLIFKRERFERSAVMVYAVFDLGVIVYWVLPTAPPWYAAREGVIEADPALRRLMVEQGKAFWRDRWEPLYSLLAGNPLAAMPSLHFATSVMAAFVLADAGPVEGAVGWTYALTLGFALVYLGEHYVVDLLAGLGLVLGIRRLERPMTPAFRAIGRTVRALETRTAG